MKNLKDYEGPIAFSSIFIPSSALGFIIVNYGGRKLSYFDKTGLLQAGIISPIQAFTGIALGNYINKTFSEQRGNQKLRNIICWFAGQVMTGTLLYSISQLAFCAGIISPSISLAGAAILIIGSSVGSILSNVGVTAGLEWKGFA